MVEVRVVPRGLLVDWGGVLTSGLEPALRRWAELDGFDFDSYLAAVMKWLPSESVTAELNPVHALERGQLAVPDFERKLASMLVRDDGTPVPAEGLIERMFAHFEHQPAMSALVRRANERGIRTALLSNSWGNTYPRDTWDGMFDDIVISGEVGLRKPEPEIYHLTASRLGVATTECVFVDDLGPNVKAAERLGMVGVRHVSAEHTIAALETHFRLDLAVA